jgi:cytochrome d ubiquinol oxidase subunit II
MLLGLIFRAVSFEFRAHATRKHPWSLAFGWGSLVAAVSQGLAFGGLLWGIDMTENAQWGVFDWLTPFSIVTAIAVLAGYLMFGSTYLIMKTEGELQRFARRGAVWGAGIAAACAVVDTVLAVTKYPYLEDKWQSFPGFLLTVVPSALGVAAFLLMLYAVAQGRNRLPFLCAMAFAFFGYLALSANYFPVIVPPSLTIYQAAAQPLTLRAMLYAVGIALPFLLAYNIFQYWVFRGKVTKSSYEEE